MTRTHLTGLCLATLATLGLAMPSAHAQAVFTAWDFDNNTGGTSTATPSPTPSIGTGTAGSLGMNNTYGTPGPSADASDVFTTTATADQGSSDPNQTTASSNIWRIRGGPTTTGGTAANGWSSSAPQYTQGAKFVTSTVGETSVVLSFDWYATKRGVDDLAVLYTIDGTNYTPTGFVFSSPQNATNGNTVWMNGNTVNFSGIPAVNNNPNFGIELVSTYHGATGAYQDTTGSALNNSSGNWRFDEVKFTGTPLAAAPEPGEAVAMLIGVSALGLVAVRRRFSVK